MRWLRVRVLSVVLPAAMLLASCDRGSGQQAPPPPVADARPPASDPTAPIPLPLPFVEMITGQADPESPLPMIVAIHGLGDDPNAFKSLLEDFPVPARVILPRAPDPHDTGYSWFPVRARDRQIERLAAGIRRAEAAIAGTIRSVRATRPTVGRAIVTGFSQGGMISVALAVLHPQDASLVIPISGWLPPPLWPHAAAPPDAPAIIALHGSDDNAVAFEPARQALRVLEAVGYRVELKRYDGVRHVVTPQMRSDLFAALSTAIASGDAPGTTTKPNEVSATEAGSPQLGLPTSASPAAPASQPTLPASASPDPPASPHAAKPSRQPAEPSPAPAEPSPAPVEPSRPPA